MRRTSLEKFGHGPGLILLTQWGGIAPANPGVLKSKPGHARSVQGVPSVEKELGRAHSAVSSATPAFGSNALTIAPLMSSPVTSWPAAASPLAATVPRRSQSDYRDLHWILP